MRTREELSLTNSAENCAFVIDLKEEELRLTDLVTENHDSPLPEMRTNERLFLAN